MIRKIVPLGFDSLGVRSMATYVETKDHKILIDPGVALAPLRYGLKPHPLEWRRMDETWNLIREYAVDCDVLIVTHYHYDHHDPCFPELYHDKTIFIKHPDANINQSQRERAAFFLEAIKGYPRAVKIADGKSFQMGETFLKFSEAVYHGTDSRLGYVVELSLESQGEKFLFTSDIEGSSVEAQAKFILEEKPDIIFADGPMTYMLGYRYSFRSLENSILNLKRVLRETEVHTMILDHHLLRDLNYEMRMKTIYQEAKVQGVAVATAAEFAGRKIEMLEALRRELYAKYGTEENQSNIE